MRPDKTGGHGGAGHSWQTEGNQNVIADKFKMVSSELPEAVEAAEGVIYKNDTEQSSE